MMAILTFVTQLVMPLVMTMTAPLCQDPGCYGARSCEVSVTQEDVTTIKVDWSKVWWDLDLDCVNSMSVSLNGKWYEVNNDYSRAFIKIFYFS